MPSHDPQMRENILDPFVEHLRVAMSKQEGPFALERLEEGAESTPSGDRLTMSGRFDPMMNVFKEGLNVP